MNHSVSCAWSSALVPERDAKDSSIRDGLTETAFARTIAVDVGQTKRTTSALPRRSAQHMRMLEGGIRTHEDPSLRDDRGELARTLRRPCSVQVVGEIDKPPCSRRESARPMVSRSPAGLKRS